MQKTESFYIACYADAAVRFFERESKNSVCICECNATTQQLEKWLSRQHSGFFTRVLTV